MSDIRLVTVSDDRSGRKGGMYGATQTKINNLIGNSQMDIIQEHYTIDDLIDCDPMMVNIDGGKNGRVYKPWAIQNELKKMNNGDYLIYNDCSPELWSGEIDVNKYDLNVIRSLTERANGFLVGFVKWDKKPIGPGEYGIHTHDNFTLESCIEIMHGEAQRYSYLCASGMICLRKIPLTVAIIDKWLNFNRIKECSCLNYSDIENSYWDLKPGKKFGNRHDQSVLSMVLNQLDWNYCDIAYNEMNPYNFLNFCLPNHDYQFINSNIKVG